METIEINGWQGRLGRGLAPQELRATLYAITNTYKETAKELGISPGTVQDRLDNARYKLSKHPYYIRSVRGLIAEAMRRGIIAPLALALLIGTGNVQQTQPVRRPEAPRAQTIARVQRLEEACLAA